MTDLTAAKVAEEACLAYLMTRRGWPRVAASHFLHTTMARSWSSSADPELKALYVAYKNALTAARGGTR
jgi:hypothetical protein